MHIPSSRSPQRAHRHVPWGVAPARLAALFLLMAGAAGVLAQAQPPGRSAGLSGFPLRFDSELIRLYIVGDSLEVDGIYRFLVRPGAMQQTTLFYPYPQDSLLGGARMVRLEARAPGGEWTPQEFREHPQVHGARWFIPMDRGDSLEVRCIYRQAMLDRYARYIVTTTKHWQRPLSHARFEIYLPPEARPTSFSFPFEPGDVDGMTAYVYEASDFMPQDDIVVTWDVE